AVGPGPLSAAHHRRGAPAQSGRHRRDRGHVLCAVEQARAERAAACRSRRRRACEVTQPIGRGHWAPCAALMRSFRRRRMLKLALTAIAISTLTAGSVLAQQAPAQPLSPNGVKTLAPAGAIKSTGTWNLGTRAGDYIYVAGMRGIDPKTDTLVEGDE